MEIKEEDLHNLCKEEKNNFKCWNCWNIWLIECFTISVALTRSEKIIIYL